ncbi:MULTISPECIES: hypothetical protein [Bacteria]|jgi:hypothetical protein|uniref:Uncharacterized protein n=1 Tax=Merismopedia glauca CCAP 1448/3 TaxID=1296344 RepID=A0A2T1C5V6_9CYAN|nr:hypothetical protein [Merismopedia glauca]PSB03626.1 hypothetical protein C7B64_07770 [Merismopedia glauca CCAP 1448/3]
MSSLSRRKKRFLHLPCPNSVSIPQPEAVVLVFGPHQSVDLGSLCYLVRETSQESRRSGALIDLTSFDVNRAKRVTKVIQYSIARSKDGGVNFETSYTYFAGFKRFVNWSDERKYPDVLDSKSNYLMAMKDYIADLKRKVSQNSLSPFTARNLRHHAIEILDDLLTEGDSTESDKLEKINTKGEAYNSIAVPNQENVGKLIAWCHCIFEGFYDLLVNNQPYPYALAVPEYMNLAMHKLWVFPLQKVWCCPPDRASNISGKFLAYDYANGVLHSKQHILNHSNKSLRPVKVQKILDIAQRHIRFSNANIQCDERISKGLYSLHAFLTLFIAVTGCNSSVAINLPWNEELELAVLNPESEVLGTRTVKYRAGNKPYSFILTTEFLPCFRKYLKLRKFLLKGTRFDYLFFNYGSNLKGLKQSKPVKLTMDSCHSLYKTFSKLFPEFPKVVPRELRAYKQDKILNSKGPIVAAASMQHGLSVALRNYSNGTEEALHDELTEYLKQAEEVLIRQSKAEFAVHSISSGNCIAPNEPKLIHHGSPIIPDCKTPDGCLFCEKFKLHADVIDLRKLFSIKFYIATLSDLIQISEEYVSKIYDRINNLIGIIRLENESMVSKIEYEVTELGELDEYWSASLEKLISLELP